MELAPDLDSRIRDQGFAVVPGVLAPTELDALRNAIDAHLARAWMECDCGRVQVHGAAECPGIEWLFHHPRVLEAVRACLGRQDIVFTGNCDVHKDKLGNWHKDMGRVHGGLFDDDVFASDRAHVVKAAVYLQDHSRNSDGFRIRRGSHRVDSLTGGQVELVATRPGDLLVFDVRLTHAGMLPDPLERVLWRGARALSRPGAEAPLARYLKRAWWTLRRKPHRHSVFFTYGVPGDVTEQFARRVRRFLDQPGPASSDRHLAPSLVAALEREGVGSYDFM